MLWVVGIALLSVIAAGAYWYRLSRKQRNFRIISFVALLREPISIDPAILATIAGKAWSADLGDGSSEGKDGFVVSAGPMTTITHDGRMTLINNFPSPYWEDTEEDLEKIRNLRIRKLSRQHSAWFSCDAVGVDGTTSESEVLECYQQLAKLFVELLDDNCLLIYLPDREVVFAINEETEAALRSENPVESLRATLSVPIFQIADDDPEMKQAVEKARRDWPMFVAAYEQTEGDRFFVKAPVHHGDNTEFIWIKVTALEGDRIYGELGNEPGDLGPLKLGSKVSVPVAELNDWCYADPQGQMVGGFTMEVVDKVSKRR